jgi:hypothetical protein
MSLFVALWHPGPPLRMPLPSPDYCSALRGPGGIPPFVARFDISVPKILLIEDVLFAGFALAAVLIDEEAPVPESIIVALCC